MRKITAVMVTGMPHGVDGLAQMAVRCFLEQTYPNKELLIINHGNEDFYGDDVRDVKIRKQDGEHVGALRNRAFDLASGDYLMTWDSDDWQHPDRMKYQSDRTPDEHLSVLTKRIIYDFESDTSFYRDKPTGFGSSLFYPKNTTERYKNWHSRSHVWFKCMFLKRVFIDNPPGLYVSTSHGKNITPRDEFMQMKNGGELSPEDSSIVENMKQLLTKSKN